MPVVDEIRRLSPGALRIFKEQAFRRAQQGDPTYTRLVSMPEMADIFQREELPTKQTKTQSQPLWQKGLQTATAPFQWISKNVTEPFGAVVTSPFTPSTGGTEGMGWLERERKEYEQWKEPTFTMPWGGKFMPTKGIVESLPWLAIPSAAGVAGKLGMLAKGAGTVGKVAGVAGKIIQPAVFAEKALTYPITKATQLVGKAIKSVTPVIEDAMQKAGQWALPSDELLNKAYKPDTFRKFAQWSEDKPIVGNVMRAIGGETAFVRPESQLPQHVVQRAVVNRVRLQNIGVNMSGAELPRLQKFGNPTQVLGITEDGIVQTAIPKSGQSKYLNDILENPDAYNFTTKEAAGYIGEFTRIRKDMAGLLEADGLKQSDKVHRIVKGIVTEDGKLVESKFGSDPSLSRMYDTQEEAALAHLKKGQKIVYGVNPNEIMEYEIDRTVNRIARNRFSKSVGVLGKKPIEKFAEIYPEKAAAIENKTERLMAAKNTLDVVQRILSYKAASIPGATLAKIRRELPDMAGRVEILFQLNKKDSVESVLSAMSRELRSALKTNPKELKLATKTISDINITWRDKKIITMTDIEDAIKSLNLDADAEAKIITAGYKRTAEVNKQMFKDFMTANRDELEKIIAETKTQLSPLRTDRYKFLQGYAGRERLPHKAGEVTERPFNQVPEFRGKFFDDKVVTYMERTYGDEGNKWVRTMGQAGAMSRNLTAVLDDSAPFIQGLFVMGRNPVAWAKATKGQFEFLIRPANFAKYMAKPENQALHAELVKYGSTVASFEPFEALPQLEKLAAKVPGVGTVAQKTIEQTYGRAEAAFTGFGQLARDNMWKSLRKANMPEQELQELARSLDLMTGNLSTRAMGISATQRDFESAFVFFSPRFTRASLSLVGDVFRGGIAGSEARKAIGGLMAGGAAMYMGVSKSLGQEPDFDPRSAKFMTIKVGNDHVGVGGILYSLARLGGNLATVDNPTDLLKLDRFDNPFIKFMYSKSAPLTGMVVGVLEQKDYLGQPFESPADWARFLAEKVIPFSVQPLIAKNEEPTPISFATQFMGARVFPKSSYELRDEARDKVSNGQFQTLTKLEQNRIDKLPEVQKYTEQLKSEGRDTPESLAWDNWNQEGDAIEKTYRTTVTLASKEYDQTGNGGTFKDKVDEASAIRRAMYKQRMENPQYATQAQYYTTPRDTTKMHPLDVARNEYYQVMYSPDMLDQFGNYNFEEADRREQLFTQKFGAQALDYINEYSGAKWQEPTAVTALRQARDILKPYWQIENQVWSQYSPELKQISDEIMRADPILAKRMLRMYPSIVWIRKQIALMKKQIKSTNPDIAQALAQFYSY